MYIEMRECNVRMFVSAEGTAGALTWRSLAAVYVEAMLVQCLEPLLLAVPFSTFDPKSPLAPYHELFFGKMAPGYINVVFGVHPIHKGHVLSGLKRMQSLTDEARGLPAATDDLEEPGEVSNYVRLHTVGVRNVAMVAAFPRPLTDDEIQVLPKYNTIVVPDQRDYDRVKAQLGPRGHPTIMDARRFALHLRDLL